MEGPDEPSTLQWNIIVIGAVVLVAALLSGCTTTKRAPTVLTKVTREKIVVPASLQDCPDEPSFKSTWKDEDDVIKALGEVSDVGETCRRNLRASMRIVKRYNDGQ